MDQVCLVHVSMVLFVEVSCFYVVTIYGLDNACTHLVKYFLIHV